MQRHIISPSALTSSVSLCEQVWLKFSRHAFAERMNRTRSLVLWIVLVAAPQFALATPPCVDWSAIVWPAPGLTANACVHIAADTVVGLDADVDLDTLLVDGGVTFVDGAPRNVEANLILVNGLLEVGTAAVPFTSEAMIDLTDDAACTDAYVVSGCSVNAVSESNTDMRWMPTMRHRLIHVAGGTIDLHGEARENWKFLFDGPYASDETTVTVFDGNEWSIGDQVAIASTDFDQHQAQQTSITDINPKASTPNKYELELADGLSAQRWAGSVGTPQPGLPTPFEHAEVGNLTHNIKVFASTPGASYITNDCLAEIAPGAMHHDGAEIMMMLGSGDDPTPVARLEYVEIYNGGKYGQLAQYPVHFHEVGSTPESYIRGVSVYDSANRAIVVHGTQDVLLEDNVAFNIVGHALYLERSRQFATKQNRLVQNLGMKVHSCSPLDVNVVRSKGSAAFYWEDPRNVFYQNAAAGAEFAGFYYAATNTLTAADGIDMNDRYICGDETLLYTDPLIDDWVELDTTVDYSQAAYDVAEYELKHYTTSGIVRCHGTFKENISHSSQHGLYAEDHKNTMMRLYDFLAYKNSQYGLNSKNRGITEAIRYLSADNATGVWPATHAYHMWLNSRWWIAQSHFVGESANTGEQTSADEGAADRSLPRRPNPLTEIPEGNFGVPVYGVEVYEGHMHVGFAHFEKFHRLWRVNLPFRPIAAFGRHQRFPYYSNNANNAAENISFDLLSRKLWFDLPTFQASGESTVMLQDLDGSFGLWSNPGDWIVAEHDFVLPGQVGVAHPNRQFIADWNAYVLDSNEEQYGQLIVHWCDTAASGGGCTSHNGPSYDWTQPGDAWGVIEGLQITDDSDGGDLLLARHHFPLGTRSRLGGNVLSGHAYTVDFWSDRTAMVPLLVSGDLTTVSAMDVHLRQAPVGVSIEVNVPVPNAPGKVFLVRGDEVPVTTDITANAALAPPVTPNDWFYDAATGRVHIMLDAVTALEQCTISLLFFPDP